MTDKRHDIDPGPPSTPEEAQKADAEALALINTIRQFNRKKIVDYIRNHPPSAEVIATLAFAQSRVAGNTPKLKTRRAKLRVLKSEHPFRSPKAFQKLTKQNADAKAIADLYEDNWDTLSSDISKLNAEDKI